MNKLDLFAAAEAINDPQERAAYLDRQCAGQPELRQRLDELLEAHVRSHALLQRTQDHSPHDQAPPAQSSNADDLPTASFDRHDEQSGTTIAGKYTLLETIGEGGMGAVWRAKQSEPVKQLAWGHSIIVDVADRPSRCYVPDRFSASFSRGTS